MSPTRSMIPWLLPGALLVPASFAAGQAPAGAPLVGVHGTGRQAQWPPSLSDSTAPLVRSQQPARPETSAFEPFQPRPRVHRFGHATYERFREAIEAGSELRTVPEVDRTQRALYSGARRLPSAGAARR